MTQTVKRLRGYPETVGGKVLYKLDSLDVEFPDEAQRVCDHCARPWNCTGVCKKVAKVIAKKVKKLGAV